MLVFYVASKTAFIHYQTISQFQILNQIVLFGLLYVIMRAFARMNNWLESLGDKIKFSIEFIASLTLEIYLVQYVVISRLSWMVFPLNWLAITVSILLLAWLLKTANKKLSDTATSLSKYYKLR